MPIGAALGIAAVTTAGNIYSAHKQADTATAAAKTQSDAAQQAMQYTQANTDRALQYILGQQANIKSPMSTSPAYARMYQGLGLGQQFQQAYGPPQGAQGPSGPAPLPPLGGGQPPPMAGPLGGPRDMVTLMDDNGVPRQVPRAMAAKYLAMGAKQVA